MPVNGEIAGMKVYGARNPPWTKLGKSGKPMWGLRSNGQKPGMEGIGRQGIIREALARTAYNNLYQQYGKDERGMPIVADIMAADFPSNLRKSPEAKIQERRAKAAARHAQTGAKLSGASGSVGRQVALPPGGYPF